MKKIPSSIVALAVLSLSLTVCNGMHTKKAPEKEPHRKTKAIISEAEKAIEEVGNTEVKKALASLLELNKKILNKLRRIPNRFRGKWLMGKRAMKRPGRPPSHGRPIKPARRRDLLERKSPRKRSFMRSETPRTPTFVAEASSGDAEKS